MQFSGIENFSEPPTVIWERLNNMEFISGLVPDQQKVDEIRPTGFSCRVKPGLSFFAGSLKLNFEVTRSEPQELLAVRVIGKGIGASVTVDIDITLTASETGTEIAWEAVVAERTGLLKPVGAALIQGAAERVITDFWRAFREG